MFPEQITALAKEAVAALTRQGRLVVTAESCTGGLIAAALTEVPGSSRAVYGGFVTYANQAKTSLVGVADRTLEDHGAVSEETARAMAEGALASSSADIAIAVTGIAGPAGGSAEKPVGLVHFACATDGNTEHLRIQFEDPGRQAIRLATVREALKLVIRCVCTQA